MGTGADHGTTGAGFTTGAALWLTAYARRPFVLHYALGTVEAPFIPGNMLFDAVAGDLVLLHREEYEADGKTKAAGHVVALVGIDSTSTPGTIKVLVDNPGSPRDCDARHQSAYEPDTWTVKRDRQGRWIVTAGITPKPSGGRFYELNGYSTIAPLRLLDASGAAISVVTTGGFAHVRGRRAGGGGRVPAGGRAGAVPGPGVERRPDAQPRHRRPRGARARTGGGSVAGLRRADAVRRREPGARFVLTGRASRRLREAGGHGRRDRVPQGPDRGAGARFEARRLLHGGAQGSGRGRGAGVGGRGHRKALAGGVAERRPRVPPRGRGIDVHRPSHHRGHRGRPAGLDRDDGRRRGQHVPGDRRQARGGERGRPGHRVAVLRPGGGGQIVADRTFDGAPDEAIDDHDDDR